MRHAFVDSLCKKYGYRYTKGLQKECDTLSFMCEDVSAREIFIKQRMKQLKGYRSKLEQLLQHPLVEQKTDAWYTMRQNMITASDFAQALGEGKFGTVKQFYQKKCEVNIDDGAASKVNPFFKWGNMFEPVAIDIYSRLFDVKVHTFGLLKHPTCEFFGASPDGISDNGIMVEIKCPKRRKIDGEVPTQYYYQIQGQLDVCDLQECDYFECEFGVCDSIEEFMERDTLNGFMGIIVETCDNGQYEYSNIEDDKESIASWAQSYKGNPKTYWYLNKYNVKRVYKDDQFCKEKLCALKDVWEKVLFYRHNRQAYEVEVLNAITIETQRYKNDPKPTKDVKLSGWSFIEDNDE